MREDGNLRVWTWVRQWRIHTWTRHDLNEIAALVNPVVAGW